MVIKLNSSMTVLGKRFNRPSNNQPMDKLFFLRISDITLRKKARVSRTAKKSRLTRLKLQSSESS